MQTQQLQDNLHLLIPPILIILDDYDVAYKEQGAHMLHAMIQKLDPQCISKFGLDNVFLEVRHQGKHTVLSIQRERETHIYIHPSPCSSVCLIYHKSVMCHY